MAMENKCYHIQSKFISTKIIMFCYYGCKYMVISFLVLFLSSFGLNPQQAGIITGFRSAFQVIGGIILGCLVDYTKKQKLIFTIAILCTILSITSMPFIGYIMTNSNGMHQSEPKVGDVMNKSHSVYNQTKIDLQLNKFELKNTTLFWLFFVCSLIYGFSDGIHGLVDSRIMTHVKCYGKSKTNYSFQRLWGSIGYGLVPIIAGFFLDTFQNTSFSLFMPAFYIFVFLQLVLIFCICKTFNNDTRENKHLDINKLCEKVDESQEKVEEKPILSLFLFSLLKVDTLVVIFNSFLNGIAGIVQWSFLYLLMEDGMSNSTKTIMGISFVASSFIEAFIAPMIKNISAKLGNGFMGMSISLFGYCITFLLYFYSHNAITVFFINMIAGVTYPFYLYTAQEEIYKLSSKECLTLMFTVDRGVYSGFGGGVGGVVAGSIYNAYGGRIMYLSFAIFYAVFAVLTLFYGIYKRRVRSMPSKANLLFLGDNQ